MAKRAVVRKLLQLYKFVSVQSVVTCASQWLYQLYYVFSLFVFTDAPGANVSQDAGILVLTILISSILIYNSQNVPYKKDLEKLEYVSSILLYIESELSSNIESELSPLLGTIFAFDVTCMNTTN